MKICMKNMTCYRSSPKKHCLNDLRTNTSLNAPTEDESTVESLTLKYLDDSDYDEAYKNLLCSTELIAKKNLCEPLQYNFLRELDSYLNHLKKSSVIDSSGFVEAALIFQNVLVLYQKRADHLMNVMIKLIEKFRAYRMNQSDNTDEYLENVESNNKKKKEKKIKFYPFFDPIKVKISGTLKNIDYKVIDLSKKSTVPKTVLNFNIKVENKYSQILPYIFIENGENIGKKYDFKVNYPLNYNYAVNEEFDCTTEEYRKCGSSLKYQKNFSPFSMNLMDVDEIDFGNILSSTPDGVIFDQTVTDEIRVANAMTPNPPNTLNVRRVPTEMIDDDNDDDWSIAFNNEETNYSDRPYLRPSILKDPINNDTRKTLPIFIFGELCDGLKLEFDLYGDPVFRKLFNMACEIRQPNVKKRNKHIVAEKEKFNLIPESEGSDSPIYSEEFHDNNFINADEHELPLLVSQENVESCKKDVDMHDQNQEKIMNKQLEMVKRVRIWHDNLRPILEEEEKRSTYDIHEYGTYILNSFESKGEQKSFKELFGGLKQEEVARYFVSTLIMTNTNNLRIINSCDESDREIKIEFLKNERHHEKLQHTIGNQVNQKK